MIISATLPYPPTANKLFFNQPGKGRSKTTEYRAWIASAGYLLNIACVGKRIDGPYTLFMSVGKPDSRRRDLSNLTKPVEDLLVAHKVVSDDSDCQRIQSEWSDQHDDVFVRLTPTKAVPARNLRPAAAKRRSAGNSSTTAR